jgi:hypothetical protein
MSPSNSIGYRAGLRQIFEATVAPTQGSAQQRKGRRDGVLAGRRENRLRRWVMACGAVALAGFGVAGAAGLDSVGANGPIVFQIPAQPLATALQAYGERAGVQVLYESGSAAGLQSVAVEGEYSRDRALELLLSATNLEVRYTKPDAITLAPRNVRGKDEPPADPLVKADLSIGELRVHAPSHSAVAPPQDYNESVQHDIQSALRKNPKTRSGSYRAVVDLWIDSGRVIQRTALFQSTGEADRDAAVTTALQGLTTSRQPPANAAQPVRVVIVVKSP